MNLDSRFLSDRRRHRRQRVNRCRAADFPDSHLSCAPAPIIESLLARRCVLLNGFSQDSREELGRPPGIAC